MENPLEDVTCPAEQAVLSFFSAASFAQERTRLVRLCERLTNDATVAEDLVQETLLVALRQAGQGKTPQNLTLYLAGIARRLCLNWRSRTAQRRRKFLPFQATKDFDAALSASDLDPLTSLLHAERAQLIDRALAEIEPGAHTLLVAYYIDERPLSEIAKSLGLTENAAAARMHRSREALGRALSGTLRADAAAHGLLTMDRADGWSTTRLWCPRCGRVRLQGRFVVGTKDGCTQYALRCADCDRQGIPLLGFTNSVSPMKTTDVLAGVKGYRAAFKRLHGWWESYVKEGLAGRRVHCVYCGRSAPVITARPVSNSTSSPGFFTRCSTCTDTLFIAPTGVLFHDAPMREFWQAHPRIYYLPEQRVHCEGRDALLVGFADRQSSACLEMILDRDDLRPLRVFEKK